MTRDSVLKEWHGDRELTYEHDKYWPALIGMCNKRKKEYMERWRQLGAKVGISEWDYKNGPALLEMSQEVTVEKIADSKNQIETEEAVIDICQQTEAT